MVKAALNLWPVRICTGSDQPNKFQHSTVVVLCILSKMQRT